MHRHAEIEMNREMLKRIVALLFSLAALADSVAARPRRTRCEVLHFLRPAEIVAWSVALEAGYGLIASQDLIEETFSHTGNSASDAVHMGAVLRALALMLLLRFALHRSFPSAQEGKNNRPARHLPSGTRIKSFAQPGVQQSVSASSCRPAIPP